MKSNAKLGSATRAVGKLFFGLLLLVVAVAAGFGGTALFVYHHLEGGRAPASRNLVERKGSAPNQDKVQIVKKEDNGTRPVAAVSSDQPSYTYADNNAGQPSTPSKRVRSVASVPAALENVAPQVGNSDPVAGLNDPESHYITDARTGRVVGIDGSAGARREEEEEQRRIQEAPRAVAVQTPVPEIRVASAVVEDGLPVYRDGQSLPATGAGAQYLPVRRALPVTADTTSVEPRNFNVAEYLAEAQPRPVLRAQPVGMEGTRDSRTTRVYRLSDGSRVVSAQ